MILAIQSLLEKFMDLSYGKGKPVVSEVHNHIQTYTYEVISMHLMLQEFNDAICEGGG